jgi:uncharacterized protein (TIGR02678 family)
MSSLDGTSLAPGDGIERRRKAWSPEAGLEVAAAARLLMRRPWLVAGRDDEDIAAVLRNYPALRDLFGRLGWPLYADRDLVRLFKTPPARLGAFAAGGPGPQTLQWFFLLVAGAETLGRKVSLGALVGAARTAAADAGVASSGSQPERRAIVGAIRMLTQRGVIVEVDGDVEDYLHDEDPQVLIEVHHARLLHVIGHYGAADPVSDPEAWLATVTREPDVARRMRRRLVDDTVVHTVDLDADEADWMSRRVRTDDGAPLAEAFGLHLERRAEGAAFVVPDEAFRFPSELGPLTFPGTGTAAHAAYLIIEWAQDNADEGAGPGPGWHRASDVGVGAKLTELADAATVGAGGWRAELVDDPTGLLRDAVVGLLTGLDLVRLDPSTGDWLFAPVTARWRSTAAPSRPTKRRRTAAAVSRTFDFGGTDEPDPS